MNRGERFEGFHLNDDHALYEEVSAIHAVDLHTQINEGQTLLHLERQPRPRQLWTEAGEIGTLEKAGAQRTMNADRALDDH
jgi:hypothetical protein